MCIIYVIDCGSTLYLRLTMPTVKKHKDFSFTEQLYKAPYKTSPKFESYESNKNLLFMNQARRICNTANSSTIL